MLHGDAGSEQFLSEIFNAAPAIRRAHLSMESIYEYGSRAGVWRLLREFEQRELPLTVFGVGMALQRHPEVTAAFVEPGHEIACHGWRWIHYQYVDEADRARAHAPRRSRSITRAHRRARRSAGTPAATAPTRAGWWPSTAASSTTPTTTATTCRSGRGAAATATRPHLIVPYTLDANDMRFATPQGFNTGDQFFALPADTLRRALRRRRPSAPKMMSRRHALPPARPAGPHRRAAALPRPRRAARPRLGLPPHRHRAALDARHPAPPASR